jgi:hypothetical protein
MDFAIQDKEGNLSLPNGTTVNGTSNGASTPSTNGNANSQSASIPLPVRSDPSTTQRSSHTGTFGVKSGLAQMLKGGVIMDVMNVEQAKVAEEAGAVAVMALERIPSLIRSQGGIARMVSSGSFVAPLPEESEAAEPVTFLPSCHLHNTSSTRRPSVILSYNHEPIHSPTLR